MSALASAEEIAARFSAAFGPCPHERAVPVALIVTGEVVAALCEDCGQQLPASWGCDDCQYLEVRTLCQATASRIMGRPCTRHAVGSLTR